MFHFHIINVLAFEELHGCVIPFLSTHLCACTLQCPLRFRLVHLQFIEMTIFFFLLCIILGFSNSRLTTYDNRHFNKCTVYWQLVSLLVLFSPYMTTSPGYELLVRSGLLVRESKRTSLFSLTKASSWWHCRDIKGAVKVTPFFVSNSLAMPFFLELRSVTKNNLFVIWYFRCSCYICINIDTN